MAENILRLKSLPVGKAMIPLEEAAMAAEDAAYEDLLSVVRTHGYSRIPLYRGSREHVVGMVHVMDLACAEGERSSTAELARGVLTVRKDTSVADALWRLRQARQQLGVVTDADGVAVGIVTVKDLVEEIVGELEAW
jgi:CBS domain containing-hemolysin-like protein